uniref:Uncharacterized protein n=1 Tax=Fagus sylvatica TaxID=28930 RepID=A0A2N9HBK4_FAGSY
MGLFSGFAVDVRAQWIRDFFYGNAQVHGGQRLGGADLILGSRWVAGWVAVGLGRPVEDLVVAGFWSISKICWVVPFHFNLRKCQIVKIWREGLWVVVVDMEVVERDMEAVELQTVQVHTKMEMVQLPKEESYLQLMGMLVLIIVMHPTYLIHGSLQ